MEEAENHWHVRVTSDLHRCTMMYMHVNSHMEMLTHTQAYICCTKTHKDKIITIKDEKIFLSSVIKREMGDCTNIRQNMC
jgi:myosin-crossreactive antigen